MPSNTFSPRSGGGGGGGGKMPGGLFKRPSIPAPASSPPPPLCRVSKGSVVTVILSGGVARTKKSRVQRVVCYVLPLFCYLEVYNGNISLLQREDDVEPIFTHSVLAIKALNYCARTRNFSLVFFEEGKWSRIHLRAPTRCDALEWILLIKHELRNQVLVCKTLFTVLCNEGHTDRAEPLFLQMLDLVRVIYGGRDHFELAKTERLYAAWLVTQPNRLRDAEDAERRAAAIKQRCENQLLY